MVFVAIFSCLLIMYGVIYTMSKQNNLHRNSRNDNSGRISLEETVRRQAQEREDAIKAIFDKAEFVNKNCDRLEDFVVNEDLNAFDLRKLAQLNGINLEIPEAWFALTLDLVRELDAVGWNRKVSCIKEKYASLRFYTDYKHDSPESEIIEKYEHKSEHVCQTCGRRGEKRFGGNWEYVACYEHYRKNRGQISLTDSGFVHNKNEYFWSDVKEVTLDEKDRDGNYALLKIGFHSPKVKESYSGTTLYVRKSMIGFGKFILGLPDEIALSDRDYPSQFESADYCEICGFEAVYSGECECCENPSWESYRKRWDEPLEGKRDFIVRNQLSWALDEGDVLESEEKNYQKNPNHEILFTSQELEKARRYESEENQE